MNDVRRTDAASSRAGIADQAARPPRSDEASAFRFSDQPKDESVAGLIRQLTEQGSHLADQQMSLVKAEIGSALADVKQSAGAMAGAAILGLAGLGVLLLGIAYLVAEAIPLWAATLLVGAVTLGVAYAMFAAGQKKLQSSSFDMPRTRRTLERAPTAVSGQEGRTNAR